MAAEGEAVICMPCDSAPAKLLALSTRTQSENVRVSKTISVRDSCGSGLANFHSPSLFRCAANLDCPSRVSST